MAALLVGVLTASLAFGAGVLPASAAAKAPSAATTASPTPAPVSPTAEPTPTPTAAIVEPSTPTTKPPVSAAPTTPPADVDRAAEGTASVVGTVKDAAGAVVPGIRVRAYDVVTGNEVGTSGVSDATGKYAVTNLPVGTYKVSFRHQYGYAPYDGVQWWNKKFTFETATTLKITTPGQSLTGTNMVLSKWESVTGTVKDAAGAVVPGIRVRAYDVVTGNEVGTSGVSDATGKYAVTNLPVGTYKVSFRHQYGYAPYDGVQWWNKKFTFETATTLKITTPGQSLTGTNMVLSKWESVTGTVKDAAGAVVPGIRVRAYDVVTGNEVGTSGVSDATGKYAVTNLPVGTYKVSFRHQYGYAPYDGVQWWNKKFTYETATTLKITTPGQSLTGTNMVLSKWESVTGTVKDAGGAVVPGIRVRAYDVVTGNEVGTSGVSDATGKYAVTNLPVGTYKVSFRHQYGYAPYDGIQWWNKKFTFETATTLKITTPGQSLTGTNMVLSKWESVTGTVKDAAGAVVPGIRVRAYDVVTGNEVGTSGVSDATGKYAVTNLPVGTYKVSFRHQYGYAPYDGVQWWNKKFTYETATTLKITTPGQSLTGTNMVLSKWESIKGTVKGDAATPVVLRGVKVTATNQAGVVVKTTTTDASGAFILSVLPPGTYKLSFAPTGSTPGGTTGEASYPATQWWNKKYTAASATPLTITTAGQVLAPISVVMVHFFQSAPSPKIAGTVGTGSTLTATAAAWSPTPTKVTYQWHRGCVAIPGATGLTYKQVAADAGKAITFTVAASKTYFRSETRTSNTLGGTAGKLDCTDTPIVSGTPQVGALLEANPGEWRPTPVTYTYKWLRNGVAIAGATARTYTPTAADLGKAISVTVTGSRTGVAPESRTSAATAPVVAAPG